MQNNIKTKRQQILYRYLTSHGGDFWRSREEIVEVGCPGLYSEGEGKANASTHQILDDIKAINDNSEFEKIIIYKGNMIKIANEEEAKEYSNHFLKKALLQLKHYHSLLRKIKSEGQGQLLDCELKFIERYLKGGN